ncbi:Exodeoxyribonuclease I [Candidatus Saccharibacteria bacterium RAAC3_TM7_1]|nr:Exodeoxyribonuclease I [Candidatus Saccharibacteria bacterium RAAC3_TM7_1]HCZ28331.1 exodeoxyribonuclease I [Candidatus Saccharibacteria bacterium]
MQTFYFYDLETSGLSGRDDRIMQFAGIRTDRELNPIGEPHNVLVRLNDDTLPSPDAIMVTGITPQDTQRDGLTEAEFAKFLMSDVFTEESVTVGFNNVRFDDEFIRHLLWRNFHDPYEWAWSNGRSRWDILDVVRMTRALRPEGIEWPVDNDGQPTNRLELISKVNGIEHTKAHDALSDVEALIAVAKLIRDNQRKLFDYLFTMRDKKAVQKLVNLDEKQPFVYTSGRYETAYNKTTVAFPLTAAPNGNVVVYDLRHDPTPFIDLSVDELKKRLFATWEQRKADDFVPVPLKVLQYNRTPAVAPLGVLEEAGGWQKISLDIETVEAHKKILLSRPDFAEKLRSLYEKSRDYPPSPDVEAQLYDGFIDGSDKVRIEAVRNASPEQLADFQPNFSDERLSPLLLHYKARSFPGVLSEDEVKQWEAWRASRLQAQLPRFASSLQRLAAATTDDKKQFLLQELQLWAEAILPADDDTTDSSE